MNTWALFSLSLSLSLTLSLSPSYPLLLVICQWEQCWVFSVKKKNSTEIDSKVHTWWNTGKKKSYCIWNWIWIFSESGWEREASWNMTAMTRKASVLWSSLFLHWNWIDAVQLQQFWDPEGVKLNLISHLDSSIHFLISRPLRKTIWPFPLAHC